MNEIMSSSVDPSPLPEPRVGLRFRAATLADLPAMDALQKQFSKQLGFFPRAQMEGYIKNGWVLVADEVGSGGAGGDGEAQPATEARLMGYCASRDRYQKRDELGAVFQLCVTPGAQRKLVGAALLREVFNRAPYGCRLFCCWCAQDIAANHFWESMGFVPLAYRAGSRERGTKGSPRVHIFWQKRIRANDQSTPWWFPSQTSAGSIREDRLVLPIPPGTHWSEARPLILPGENPALPDERRLVDRSTKRREKSSHPLPHVEQPKKCRKVLQSVLRFESIQSEEAIAKEKPRKAPRHKIKCNPMHMAAARELRDRYLEQVNEREGALKSAGKYDVVRALAATTPLQPKAIALAERCEHRERMPDQRLLAA